MRKLLFLFSLLALACSGSVAPPKLEVAVSPILICVHVDSAFSQLEQELIHEAAQRVTFESRGWITIGFSKPLVFNASASIPGGHFRLVKTDSTSSVVMAVDSMIKAERHQPDLTCGYADSDSIFLVTDRIISQGMFIHVAEHELGHAAGLNHYGNGVMALYTSADSAVHLSDSDRVEVWNVLSRINRPASPDSCSARN